MSFFFKVGKIQGSPTKIARIWQGSFFRSPAIRSPSKTPPTKITTTIAIILPYDLKEKLERCFGEAIFGDFLRASWRFPIWILKIKVVVTKWIGHGSDVFFCVHDYMATTIPPKNPESTLRLKHPILVIARHGLHKRWRSKKCRFANGRLEKFPWTLGPWNWRIDRNLPRGSTWDQNRTSKHIKTSLVHHWSKHNLNI